MAVSKEERWRTDSGQTYETEAEAIYHDTVRALSLRLEELIRDRETTKEEISKHIVRNLGSIWRILKPQMDYLDRDERRFVIQEDIAAFTPPVNGFYDAKKAENWLENMGWCRANYDVNVDGGMIWHHHKDDYQTLIQVQQDPGTRWWKFAVVVPGPRF